MPSPADRAGNTPWLARLKEKRERFDVPAPLVIEGRVTRMVGLTLEAVGCPAAVGERCLVVPAQGEVIEAEVVGFADDITYLMPSSSVLGLTPGARVVPTGMMCDAPVGPGLLGRVVDGRGRPLDGKGEIEYAARVPLAGKPVNPLSRQPIKRPLDVGIRAINSLITVGKGQRVGLFAGSGVGKSVLLGMMTRFTDADVVVVVLIGERGREVKEFIEDILGKEGMARAVVVATPADSPPLMRLHGAMLTMSIAEYFRDAGKHVLLLMDSLTRYAQAQREIGLAIGEPPTSKGYPPSVFAKLPQLVERAGNGGEGNGTVTAFFTVLTEGDDQQDPVADASRAILDGHVVLSRQLSEAGHYPAIDIEASVSRLMVAVADEPHRKTARQFRKLNSLYLQNRDLISVGAYARGGDALLDKAIEQRGRMMDFLQQNIHEPVSLTESVRELKQLIGPL